MSPGDSWSIYIYILQKLVQEMCSTMSDTVLVFWILNINEIQTQKKIPWTVFFKSHFTYFYGQISQFYFNRNVFYEIYMYSILDNLITITHN